MHLEERKREAMKGENKQRREILQQLHGSSQEEDTLTQLRPDWRPLTSPEPSDNAPKLRMEREIKGPLRNEGSKTGLFFKQWEFPLV